MKESKDDVNIAIVGMAATFAGAASLDQYWQNILDKVDAMTDAPDVWALPYFDPQTTRNDRIYTRRGGFLGELAEFDPSEFGIMPNSVDGGEPDQYLALKIARDALRHAGYDQRPFDREKTGIILGRGTYVNRGYSNLMQHGMIVDQTLELVGQLCESLTKTDLDKIRGRLKESLPPFNPDMCPGLVPNVVSGRIANRLDLMGPNFIVDAACASSLIAVDLAIKELLSGSCDMILAGGIHASTPPQIYMIFCQLEALSRSKMRPFDANANGTLLGEGLGMLVLKRLEDAERDGDTIYALLKSVGTASDGKALGLLAPRLEGEVLALQRAYHEAGIDPGSIGLIEAHGTAIRLGDQTEVAALTQVFGARTGDLPRCGLGSVKSMISHCIPAAGVAGIIKTALALHHKILPPTLCDEVNPALGIESTPFYINTEARPWIHADVHLPRRAGVNAFGFGGINAHAVLEEYRGASTVQHHLHKRWPVELLIFSSATRAGLLAELTRAAAYLQAAPQTPLADLAYTLPLQTQGEHRLALVAKDYDDALRKLANVMEKLRDPGKRKLQSRSGIYYDAGASPGRLAFLFPGEGAQYANMLGDLCLYFPVVREWFDFLDQTYAGQRDYRPSSVIFPAPTGLSAAARAFVERELFKMDLGSECVFTASMALNDLLGEFGIKADAMVGHSTGENAALLASGTMQLSARAEIAEKMRLLNVIYRNLEASGQIPTGGLLTVGAVEHAVLEQYLSAHPKLHLAMDNCANQAVLFGDPDTVAKAATDLGAMGGICLKLPFDRAYHTPLFEGVGSAFRPFYDSVAMGGGHTPLYSCATAVRFPDDPLEIRALAQRQWSSRVRFRETMENLYAEGFRTFVEVGPAGNLTSFAEDIFRGRDCIALASNSRRRPGLEQLLHLLARLYAAGYPIDLQALYRRSVQHIDLAAAVPLTTKRKYALALHMPIMRLPESDLKDLRARLTRSGANVPDTNDLAVNRGPLSLNGHGSPSTAEHDAKRVFKHSPPAAAGEGRGNALSDVHAKPGVAMVNGTVDGAAPADARLSMLNGHFDLMQEFLAHQARVWSLFQPQAAGTTSSTQATADANIEVNPYILLGKVCQQSADELITERTFTLEHDSFLCDHTLGSRPSSYQPDLLALPVIPFTFSMEIIAEAALYLDGGQGVVTGMRQLRGYRWLTLDQGSITLLVHARLTSANAAERSVAVRLYQLTDTDTRVLVFEGEVALADAFPEAPMPMPFDLGSDAAPARLDDAHLYTTGMFHGPRLQGVKHLQQWSSRGIDADLQVIALDEYFSSLVTPVFATDAGLLDAAGQLVGYWLTEQFGSDFNCFPFQVQSFRQFAKPLPAGSRVRCRGLIAFSGERQIVAHFDLLDEAGSVIARLEGWEDRHFSIPNGFYRCRLEPQQSYLSQAWAPFASGDLMCRRVAPFPADFLETAWGIWRRVLAHLVLNHDERAAWYKLTQTGTQASQWLLGRIAAKDVIRQWAAQRHNLALAPVDIEIKVTDLGKPYVVSSVVSGLIFPDISITHSGGCAIAALTDDGGYLGIDLQFLDGVQPLDVLTGAFGHEEQAIMHRAGVQNEAIIALWCAKEAAAKAMGTGLMGVPRQWQVVHCADDVKRATIHHNGTNLTVDIWRNGNEIFTACRYSPLPEQTLAVQ